MASATGHWAVPNEHADPTRALSRAGVVVVVLVFAAEVSTHLVDFGVYRLRISVLDANLGSSPVAWIGPAAIALAVVSSCVLARRRRVSRLLPLALGVVLILATRHVGESLPHWQVLLLPPLGLALALLWRGARGLDPLASRTCRAGCVLLVLAFAFHVLGAALLHGLGYGDLTWPFQVKVALKEGSEIAGWLLVASALAATAWGSFRADRDRRAPHPGRAV